MPVRRVDVERPDHDDEEHDDELDHDHESVEAGALLDPDDQYDRDDRGDHGVRRFVDFYTFANLQIRYVQRMLRVKPGNIQIDGIGRFCRFAEDLDLTHGLRQDRAFFLQCGRFAEETDRNGHFDLLTLGKPPQIGMDHPAQNRVNLPILKDDVS